MGRGEKKQQKQQKKITRKLGIIRKREEQEEKQNSCDEKERETETETNEKQEKRERKKREREIDRRNKKSDKTCGQQINSSYLGTKTETKRKRIISTHLVRSICTYITYMVRNIESANYMQNVRSAIAEKKNSQRPTRAPPSKTKKHVQGGVTHT